MKTNQLYAHVDEAGEPPHGGTTSKKLVIGKLGLVCRALLRGHFLGSHKRVQKERLALLQAIAAVLLILFVYPVVSLAAESSFPSYYPEIAAPEHLLVIDRVNMSHEEYLMVASLQGILAQDKPRIYITNSWSGATEAPQFWLDSMKENYGVTTETRTSAIGLVEEFKDEIAGYFLVEIGKPRLNVANSLAGLKRGILVTEGLVDQVRALGLSEIPDQEMEGVRPRDIPKLEPGEEFDMYQDEFNNSLIFTAEHFALEMRDLIIASRGFIFHETEDVAGNFFDENEVYGWVQGDSPQIGWGGVDKEHEDAFVGDAAVHGIFTIPANHVMNLSTHLGVQKESLEQKDGGGIRPRTATAESTESAHYLAIMMSDGDNYSFVMQGLADDEKYFGSPHRGDFPMNWTMPTTIIDMAPATLEWYYNNAKQDFFVAGASGAGYMFPSWYPDQNLKRHMSRYNEYLGRGGLPIGSIIDFPYMGEHAFHRIASLYAKQPNLEGIVYLNFQSYAAGGGQMVFVGDTPFISMRENLWEFSEQQQVELAQRINSHSTDVSTPGAYTIMNVHAWSHDMADVAALVERLAPHVEVVTVQTLFEKVKANVDREPYSLPNLHFATFYDEASGVQVEGDALAFINDGDHAAYYGVDFGEEGFKDFEVRASSGSSGGTIELRLDGQEGELIGVMDIGNTGGWQDWQTFSASIGSIGGKRDLYITFIGGDDYLFNLDSFDFKETPVMEATVRPGVALKVFGEEGRQYKFETTTHLGGEWRQEDDPIPGADGVIRRFFPFEKRESGFYRVLID